MVAKTFVLWATVIRWVDGDTFSGWIDQGFYRYYGSVADPIRARCALINSPEMSTIGGQPAKVYAERIAPPGEYRCISYKPDNFGRPLVDLELPQGLFSRLMIDAGYADVYKP